MEAGPTRRKRLAAPGAVAPLSTKAAETTVFRRPVPRALDLLSAPESYQLLSSSQLLPARRSKWIRAANLLAATVACILLAPLLAFIALLVWLDSGRPILYRQERVGIDRRALGFDRLGRRTTDMGSLRSAGFDGPDRRERPVSRGRRHHDIAGQPFGIYKFRTMRVDAEDETGPVWAAVDDDRVTRLGTWLRRLRLDELPQLWNVIRGDMNVVGPRPERPVFVNKLRDELAGYPIRQRVRPGITGLAQVSRGADQNVDDVRRKLAYDLAYLRRRSVMLDLLIILKTIPTVARRCLRG